MIRAIRENNSLLQGKGRNLQVEEYLREKGELHNESTPYVDGHTIVWETIHWWQELGHFLADKEQAKEAEKYLCEVGKALTIPRKEKRIRTIGDGFIHVTPQEEGKKPYLTYESADKFLQCWNHVEEAFKTKKKRYQTITQPLLEEMRERGIEGIAHALRAKMEKENIPRIRDIRKIIENKLGDKISVDELKRFNLEDIGPITASYRAWKHESKCPICQLKKTKKVGYKTIQRLIKEAEKELKKT